MANKFSLKEFVHYSILFVGQIFVWSLLTEWTNSNFPITFAGWFIASILIDKFLHKYFKLV